MNPRHKGYKRILHCHWCEDTSRCHDTNGMKKVNSLNMTPTDFILLFVWTLCDAGHKEHKQIFVDLSKFTEQEAQEMETPPLEHQSEIRHSLIYVSRSIQSDSKPFATVLTV